MSNVNIPVPFFSQRDNSFIWKYRYEKDTEVKKIKYKKGAIVKDNKDKDITAEIWDGCCNITCLAMVLNYLGVTKDTPYQMSEKIFADGFSSNNATLESDFDRYVSYRKYTNEKESTGYQCIESPDILKKIAYDIYNVRNVYCSQNTYTLSDVKKEVEAGYPVIVSCGITRPSKEWMQYQSDNNTKANTSTLQSNLKAANNDSTWEYHGHYIVIKGFTDKNEVIVNDPWGKAINNAGKIPTELINNAPKDAWGAYNDNICGGTNKGENIVISQEDFCRQYNGKLFTVLIVYDRRWSFPFKDILTNFIKINQGTYQRYLPDNEQIENCYKLLSDDIHFPITSTCSPHNGIHIDNGKNSKFYSIGSGMLVAAKLCFKKDEKIENGSNCFILVKHQIQMPKTTATEPVTIKTFFCLYNHIMPLSFTEEEINSIRFLNEIRTEKDKQHEIKSFNEKINESRKVNSLKNEAEDKYNRLTAGETVIFNDGKIVSEVCEGDFLGYTGSKGFDSKSVKSCLHWEIFSNEDIFDDITKFSEYKLLDFSNTSFFNREEVIELCKKNLFFGFSADEEYKKFTKHLGKNAIATKGIEAFYKSKYGLEARIIKLRNKSEWDSNRNFSKEYNDSNQKGYVQIKDVDSFSEKYIKPFLWWDSSVDNAINKDLLIKINNKTPFYYDPINFLVWLMRNDDDLYKQICPKAYSKEFT